MNGKGVTLSEGLFARIMNDLRGIFRKKGKKDAVQQKPPQVKTSPPKPPKAMEIAQSAKPSQRPVSEAKEMVLAKMKQNTLMSHHLLKK